MSLFAAALAALVLIGLLFVVAALVETNGIGIAKYPRFRHVAYTLSLGVYCSSWTFYGAVGSAAREGWTFLPIYLAPALMLLLAPRFLKQLAQAVADEQATSVSDFIAARFNHDVIIARLVTVIALLGTVPYIALQLRSIGNAMAHVSGHPVQTSVMAGAALLLALFAVLFGARRFDLAARSEGLLFAIGLESLIKIAALVAVGALALTILVELPSASLAVGLDAMAKQFSPARLNFDVLVIGLISAMAVIVLPRQFYMGLVEAKRTNDLSRARFGLAGYLGAVALLTLPIALAGASALGGTTPSDLFVLELPIAAGSGWITTVALLGGISAAASMVIVEATALAAMVSNDLIFPTVLRNSPGSEAGTIGRRMLAVRRGSILGIVLVSLAWALLLSVNQSLASIGLVAFAAMAQFTPHLILAVRARQRDPLAARVSLSVGMVLWFYTLALPQVLPEHWLATLARTPLDPLRLLGIGDASPLVHGVAWSLGANLISYAVVSARNMGRASLPRLLGAGRSVTNMGELIELTASFVGRERAELEFSHAQRGQKVDGRSATRARQIIAGVVGASSARTLVASALAGGQMNLQDVTRLLDEGGQSLRFSRQLLAATFENLDAGISVVDGDLNLVAWNERYEELFDYPEGMVRVGAPIAELIRHNARRGDFGPGDIEYHVEKRLEHLRRGSNHTFERTRPDGRVLKTVGGPMPRRGYVMSFTDITEDANVRAELQHTLEQLEQRVDERTRALREANERLAKTDRDKTRFLAAASHDLLQPLHAARLFSAALARDVPAGSLPMVQRLENSITAAEDLLRALLDISRIDAGGVTPNPEALALAPFLSDLAEGFRPLADDNGLILRTASLRGCVYTDPGLLRSIVQNFLSNALRYTLHGSVLVGVRKRGDHWRIDVIDTGVGIDPQQVPAVFGEFTRLGTVEAEGLGLGLALSDRIARLLGGSIDVASEPGKGSRFSLLLPQYSGALPNAIAPRWNGEDVERTCLDVLVVDNDPRIVEATLALLTSLGHRAIGAAAPAEALYYSRKIDAVLADYQLDDGEDGLSLIEAMRAEAPSLPAMLITAENRSDIRVRAAALGVPVLAKPVVPREIETFLAEISVSQIEPE